jgi:hypothetical protein
VTVSVLETLARDPDEDVRVAVMRNRLAGLTVRLVGARDASADVRRAAIAQAEAKNEQESRALEAMLEERAADADSLVREAVVIHPQTPLGARCLLARDRSCRVRQKLVLARETPPLVLEVLAGDPDPLVRLAVAAHPLVTTGALDTLALDASSDVRGAVADHCLTSVEALRRLALDSVAAVREVVALRSAVQPTVREALAASEVPIAARRAHAQYAEEEAESK